MSDLVLKDKDGNKKTYDGVTQIKIKNSDGSFETFSKGGGEIPDGYIKPTGTKTIIENGLYDVGEFEKVDVIVQNSGGGETKLYKFNDTIDESGSFESYGYGDHGEEFIAKVLQDGAKVKNLTIKMGEEVLTVEQTTVLYPAIVGGNFTILLYDESSGAGTSAIYVSGNGFLMEIVSFEIVDYGKYRTWFEANTTRIDDGNSGGAEFNIAFGNIAPEDTSKLWVKTADPESVEVKLGANFDFLADGTLETLNTTLQSATAGMGTVAIGTKIFIFGGYNGNDLDTISVFSAETNKIETLNTKLPDKRSGCAVALVGTKIYMFGGYDNQGNKCDSIFVFDIVTYKIETLSAKLPTVSTGASATAIGTKIYIFGGSDSKGITDTIYIFDTENNECKLSSAKFNGALTGLTNMSAVAIGSKIYIVGGQSSAAAFRQSIFVYDVKSDQLTLLSTELPTGSGVVAASMGTKIYTFGGYTNNGLHGKINVFDVETHDGYTLSVALPTPIQFASSVAVGTNIYILGGKKNNGYVDTIQVFNVSIDLPYNNLLIEASAFENHFTLLPNMEMGVKNVYLGNADGKGERVPAALYKEGAWVEI